MDQQTKTALFEQLSRQTIDDWAGATIAARGQSYQRGGHVTDMARTAEGEVVAWVHGTRRYATLVDMDEGGLISACTCPYGGTCKHAVALALAYREHLQRRRSLPTAPDTDPRLVLLDNGGEDWEEEDWEQETEDEAPSSSRTRTPLRGFLQEQTKAQLVEMIEELAARFPDMRAALEARRKLATGTAEQLVRDIRRLIITISSEPGWRNEWDGEGSTPDYTPVRDRLELLLRQGYADEVVSLGEVLLKAGIEQVEQSHDEGETAGEIGGCMRVVFRALPRSSLAPSAQIVWAIDALLQDDYDLCHGAGIVLEQPYSVEDWSRVADSLSERLRDPVATARRTEFSAAYARGQLTSWIITALEHAGRIDEVIPLAEREAELNGDYVRLVKLLVATGRPAEAEQWIVRGIAALGLAQPGTARQLGDTLREMREQAGDWPMVAAMRAEDFFEQPSMPTLLSLRAAAERAGVWEVVEAAAMRYLETGERPGAAGQQEIRTWPLPPTGLPRTAQHLQWQFPLINLLIQIAAHERQPDRVLYWYDRRSAAPRSWVGIDESLVADAVADAYPERAIAIWKQLAEAQIAQTQTRAYEVAVGFLRKLGDLLGRHGRADEWRPYIAELRQANARKRRLVEMLDGLSREGVRGANAGRK